MNIIQKQFVKEKEAGKRVLPKFWFCLAIFFGFGGIVSIFSGNLTGILMILFAWWFYSLSNQVTKNSS